jgi:general stress protein 26
MDKKIFSFLKKHRVGALTTVLKNGTPHAAALHFSHREEPFELYFSTENTSKKCEDLLTGKRGNASFVVGLSEEEWITLQMDGEIVIVSDKNELADIQKIHYKKHPSSEKYKDEPATVFLKFTPKWWRYTDYNTDTTITSDL